MKDSNWNMLHHDDLPVLVKLATEVKNLKELLLAENGIVWESEQQLPASWLTVEETQGSALVLGEQLKSLKFLERSSVRRGDSPITDSLIDDSKKVLRKELYDLTRFKESLRKGSRSSGVTALPTALAAGARARAGAVLSVAAASRPSSLRDGSMSRVLKDLNSKRRSTGVLGARVAVLPRAGAGARARGVNSTSWRNCSISRVEMDVGKKQSSKGAEGARFAGCGSFFGVDDNEDAAVPVPDLHEERVFAESGLILDAVLQIPATEARNKPEDALGMNMSLKFGADEKKKEVDAPRGVLVTDDGPPRSVLDTDHVPGHFVKETHKKSPDALDMNARCNFEGNLDSLCMESTEALETLVLEMGFEFGVEFEFGDFYSLDNFQLDHLGGHSREASFSCGSLTCSEIESFDETGGSGVEEDNTFHRPSKRARSASCDAFPPCSTD